MTFTAHPIDDASGIERVEFYLDNNLQENLTNGPYEYIYTWTGRYPGYHWVKAIVYDFAGHSSDKSTLPVNHPTYPPILSRILYRIQILYELFLQLR